MKTKTEDKVKPEAPNPPADFKVWCEECRIRIAPFDERTVVKGKTYHARCYAKLSAPAVPLKTKRMAK